MVSNPYGGMYITGGADTVALTTTAALLDSFSESGGANFGAGSNAIDGDPAIIPDKANNRIKVNSPGIYKIEVQVSVDMATGADVILRCRKNGTAVTGLVAKQRCTTDKNQITLIGYVSVAASDSPDTLVTFADPSSSGFGGAGGAPKTLSYLDLTLEVATSTDTATIEEAQFLVSRVG